jgi:hypothetical protein
MIDRKKFFDGIRQGPFPGKLRQGQVDGCTIILDEWERRALTDLRWLAYMLATVYWETDFTMQPIKESGGLKYLKSKKYYPYYGRGYVQLTWQANYKRMWDLYVEHSGHTARRWDVFPDDVMIPMNAIWILFEGMLRAESFRGDFTGKSLEDYFNDDTCDWIGARRIINGTDRAREIAGFAKQFYGDLVAATA